MKCQIIFSRESEKNTINLPSAELTQRVVKFKVPHEIFPGVFVSFLLYLFTMGKHSVFQLPPPPTPPLIPFFNILSSENLVK